MLARAVPVWVQPVGRPQQQRVLGTDVWVFELELVWPDGRTWKEDGVTALVVVNELPIVRGKGRGVFVRDPDKPCGCLQAALQFSGYGMTNWPDSGSGSGSGLASSLMGTTQAQAEATAARRGEERRLRGEGGGYFGYG